MERISPWLLMIIMIVITCSSFANSTKPGFVVVPFSRSLPIAENSTANVLVVTQNQTGVNQTITNIVPQIPADSGITGSVISNTCGFLAPGDSCESLIRLKSGNKPSSGNLNVSVCSFNGTFCSRIVKPIAFNVARPVAILVSPTAPSIAQGTTQQFNAIGLFANSAIQDVTNSVTWGSSNTAKATISNASGSQGLATGVAAGSSTISATLGGISDSTTLTVTGATLTSITVTPINPSVPNISKEQFTAIGIYSDNSHQDLTSRATWSSSSTAVATISNALGSKGLATTKTVGGTTITATFGAVSGATTLNVTAAVLKSISVTPADLSLSISTNQQYTATGIYSDNSVKSLTNDVTWSTQSALVAIISNQVGSKGKAKGVGVGSINVTATLGGIVGSTTLTVTPAVLTSITVTPTNPSVPNISTGQFTATGIYSDNSHQDLTSKVTWISSNKAVATISNVSGLEGLATTQSVGSTTITATFGGVSGSTTLKVTATVLTSISLAPTDPSLPLSTDQQFVATGIYSDNSVKGLTNDVTWSTGSTSIAIISNAIGTQGKAKGIGVGPTSVTATLGSIVGSTTLTVTPATLTSITVTPTNPSVPHFSSGRFTAIGIYSDNSNQDLTSQVTWSSSNTAVATISNASGSKGLAATKNAGGTTITATLGGVSGATTLTVTPAVLTSISVTPTEPSLSISTTQQFTATGIYSDNSVKDLTNDVTWSTGSTSIAIISNAIGTQGKAVGVGVGPTSVTATLGSIAGSTTLLVRPAVLTGIDIAPTNLILAAGTEHFYTATGIYDNGRTQDITSSVVWQSSNENLATISNAPGFEGLARGIQAGTVTITASVELIVASTSLTVDAATLLSITVTPATPTIANGTEQQFIATGNYSDASTQNLSEQATWISSAPAIAVISNASGSKGLATTVAAGSTTITAAFNGVSGNTALTVSPATLNAITVTPANASIPTSTTAQFTATGTFSDSSTKNLTNEVTWTSSNNAIATISNAESSQGIATGVSRGSTTINAIASSITGSTTLNVIRAGTGDNLQGGKVACLNGGLNNLIAANTDSPSALIWGAPGFITNAQSLTDGGTNTTAIVTVLGPSTTYAAGYCDQYEIDSAGNTPCVSGNTCYRDWFLPSTNQLSCLRSNRNQIGGFSNGDYWTSTADAAQPTTHAFSLSFQNSGHSPDSNSKSEVFALRCVRLINEML